MADDDPCLVAGEPCTRPDQHATSSACPRCGQTIAHDPFPEPPAAGARLHSQPWTRPRAHAAPCGLPCVQDWRLSFHADQMPALGTEHFGDDCVACARMEVGRG